MITVVLHGTPTPVGEAQGSLAPQKASMDLPWNLYAGKGTKRIHMAQDQLHAGNFPQEATQVKAGCAEINTVEVPVDLQ